MDRVVVEKLNNRMQKYGETVKAYYKRTSYGVLPLYLLENRELL
ncbi:MAG: hypothetical protein QW775_02865 [Ignisphaera sp.]